MKSFFYFLGTLFFIASCVSNEQAKKLNIINNTDSEEITFILELKIISESKAEVEKFTQYLANI